VSLRDLEQAQQRTLEPGWPLILACDVARFGSDQTVLAVRRGNVIRLARSYGGRDLMRTVGEITRLARDLDHQHGRKPRVIVDDAGVGGGVTDRLRELREFEIIDYNAARRATRRSDYPNRRSEDWFKLAELLPELDLDRDEDLAADLLAPRYSLDSQGRRVVEPKAETKKRIRRSPDRADTVVMALSIERRGERKPTLHSSVPRGRIDLGVARGLTFAERRLLAYTSHLAGHERADAELAARLGVPITGFGFHVGTLKNDRG
jgi:hypothetical protein